MTGLDTGREYTLDEVDLVRSVTRDSLYQFVREFWHTITQETPRWNWHIEYLCGLLQQATVLVEKGLPKEWDLLVNISPGTTKSTIFSVMYPAWLWTWFPRCQFIGASYSEDLARTLSVKTRDVVTSDLYKAAFPEVVLREDQNTKGYFANTFGGFRYCVGVNGMVTGMHGHAIVVDDPINPNQALSAAERKKVNHWCTATLPSRKVDKAAAFTAMVMQRVHEDDPAGVMAKRDKVFHVNLPARDTGKVNPPALRGFYDDGLMDPVRLSDEVLDDIRKEQGPMVLAGQYMQDPVPEGGALFDVSKVKTVRQVDVPRMERVARAWDKAAAVTASADWTVGTKLGLGADGRWYVLDVIRKRVSTFDREELMRDTAKKDGRGCLVVLEEEGGSGGKHSTASSVRNLAGHRVRVQRPDRTKGSKAARADPLSVQVNAGNVRLVEGDWNKDWLDEVKVFPFGRWDDQVDSAAMGFNQLAQRKVKVGAA
ncbi:MAG: hypothetical protein E6R03_14620 [Hyphomicrobiaceae bacterium]|nr:MAG: hypothetical protein E6R03_14620 [Hyphomicrobiaceae bacterium]